MPKGDFYMPEQLAYGERIYDLFEKNRFGHCLPDCFNFVGSTLWDYFQTLQELGRLKPAYDVAAQGKNMVKMFAPKMAEIIARDPDLDTKNLIVWEKGAGSRDAIANKFLILRQALKEIGVEVSLYGNIEKSVLFRQQAAEICAQAGVPNINFDLDFTSELPETNNNMPRVVLEFGSPRSNIATTSEDEVPTDQLEAIFEHDVKLCGPNGILIMDCDGTQDGGINEDMYRNSAHALIGNALFADAKDRGVISSDFQPMLMCYEPRWHGETSLLRHEMDAAADQTFGVIRADGQIYSTGISRLSSVRHSNSFKWKPDPICEAAEKKGFRTLAVWMTDTQKPRFNGYAFKAPA